jgi:glycerol-3-phosphate acyltransferase PlsX
MVRDHEVDAFVSAGHSGATMAGATLILGRAEGVDRPALAGLFPALDRTLLVLDVGATTECKPEYLEQFAHLGSHYAQRALGIVSPRVALLSNGEEAVKGDRLVQEAHALLRHSKLQFVGNAEPKDALVNNLCDVLVCDGFVGNLFLKTSEAIAKLIQEQAKRMIVRGLPARILAGLAPTALIAALSRRDGRVGALLGGVLGGSALTSAALVPPLLQLRRRADYRNYGGAPLLGLRGVAIIAHGRSDAQAVMHAIRQASEAVERKALIGAPLSAAQPDE